MQRPARHPGIPSPSQIAIPVTMTQAIVVESAAALARQAEGQGAAMHAFCTQLYPMLRSITGQGVRDTLAAIAKFGITDQISYISTGGGAFLEFLEGRTLPAVAALEAAAG